MDIDFSRLALLPLFKEFTLQENKNIAVLHFLTHDRDICDYLKKAIEFQEQHEDYQVLAITPDSFFEISRLLGQVPKITKIDVLRDLYDELSELHQKSYRTVEVFPQFYIMKNKELTLNNSLLQLQDNKMAIEREENQAT